LTVTWTADATTNEDGFGIERKEGATGTFAEVKRVGANVLTWTDQGLKYNTLYTYRVFAFNATGKSENPTYSPEASATTIADPLPKAPTGLTVRAL
jgi:hypothetical protein